MGTQVLGAPIKRKEDPNLLTGNAKFTGDLDLPDMAHVAILHSPEAHATIKRLDTSLAARLPGVIRVFTGADISSKMLPLVARCLMRSSGVLPSPNSFSITTSGFRSMGFGLAVAFQEIVFR